MDYIMVKYEATNMASGTSSSRSGNSIASETVEYTVTYPEEEQDTKSEGTPNTREASGGETKSVKEAVDEGKTAVDEVVGIVIKRK